ncbi:MAG: SDR family oxidoreductase, partial [Chloroflexota bacterium]
EMTKQLLSKGEFVFATCRLPEEALELNRLAADYATSMKIVQLDVINDQSVSAAVKAIAGQTDHIDVLINNAGVNFRDSFEAFDADQFLLTLNANGVGAMRVVYEGIDLLKAAPAPIIVNVSSQLGSLTAQRPGFGSYAYNSSKAVMNMITRHLSFDLAADGFTVISMHPGWVQTDMGGSNAAVTPPDSAAGILNVISKLTPADNGKFYIYNGEIHPW